MIDTPELATTAAVRAAVVPLSIPHAEMTTAFPAALAELHRVLAAQGLAQTGPMFAYYPRPPRDRFDFEIGLPVAHDVVPSGRVVAGGLPAARVARTVHHGDYGGLPAAWHAFAAWSRAAGHALAPDFWEVYAVGPGDAAPAGWRTELVQVLA